MSASETKKILITRSEKDAEEYFRPLIKAGHDIYFFSTIKTSKLKLSAIEKDLVDNSMFDYLIFTSAKAVKYFVDMVKQYNLNCNISNVKVAVAGEKTRDVCLRYGIMADIIPKVYSAKGLLDYFETIDITGKRFLIPCSRIARRDLYHGLKEFGGIVNQLPIYETLKADADENMVKIISENKPEIFSFTSPSSFDNYLKILNIENVVEYFGNAKLVAIGETTKRRMSSKRLSNIYIPEIATIEGIAKLIENELI